MRSIGAGYLSVNTTVSAEGASIDFTGPQMYAAPPLMSIVRSIDAFTSSAVMVRPEWNVTPWRIVNVHVSPSSDVFQAVASSGSTFCVCELYRVSCSYMLFIAMISFE
jgi:hypothetical protein